MKTKIFKMFFDPFAPTDGNFKIWFCYYSITLNLLVSVKFG